MTNRIYVFDSLSIDTTNANTMPYKIYKRITIHISKTLYNNNKKRIQLLLSKTTEIELLLEI